MNVAGHLKTQQGSSKIQFLNICKICKKVYKDKVGLMEHQRQQHHTPQPSISISQQIQRLQSINKITLQQKKAQFSNGSSLQATAIPTAPIVRDESYATPPMSPPNLVKPKNQSRKQQFHSPNGESFLREDNADAVGGVAGGAADSQTGESWPKRSKKEDDPPTIISGTVAAATAACYNPSGKAIPAPPPNTNSNGSQKRPQANISQPSVQTNKPKPNQQQIISKIQQNMSNAGNAAIGNRNPATSPNGKTGLVNKAAVPKLMSKTKAQYQILKSQVMRPKHLAKPGTLSAHLLPAAAAILQANSATAAARPQPPKAVLPLLPSRVTEEPRKMGGKPPPSSVRQNNFLGKYTLGARRGGGASTNVRGGPRGGGGRGGVTQRPPPKKPSSITANASSGSESDEDSESSESEEYSIQPKKAAAAAPRRGGGASPSPPTRGRPVSRSPPNKKISQAKKKNASGIIFGEGYKCPPMNKVASYLNKKGVRIWICLVCEEPEQEISGNPMICCDGCEDWYHFFCVGINEKEAPGEDEKWFCKRCIWKKLNDKKTAGVGKSEPKVEEQKVEESESEEEDEDEEDDEPTTPPPIRATRGQKSTSRSPSPKRRRGGGGGGGGGGRGGRGRGRGRGTGRGKK